MIERLGVEHWVDWILLGFGVLGTLAVVVVLAFAIIRLIYDLEGE